MRPMQTVERSERRWPAFYDEAAALRRARFDIDPIFIARWSPRAMNGRRLAREDYLPLFEAARWAPSSYNSQFWDFIVAERGDPAWTGFLGLLTESNRLWAQNAGLLGIIVALRTHRQSGKPAPTHEFDCGSAWENLALEGASRGLVVHGMEGFDYDRARDVANVPGDHEVLAMFAVGERAPPTGLPESRREKEKPNQRRALEDLLHHGRFGQPLLDGGAEGSRTH